MFAHTLVSISSRFWRSQNNKSKSLLGRRTGIYKAYNYTFEWEWNYSYISSLIFALFLAGAKKSLSKDGMISNTLVLFKYIQTKFTSLTRHCKILAKSLCIYLCAWIKHKLCLERKIYPPCLCLLSIFSRWYLYIFDQLLR